MRHIIVFSVALVFASSVSSHHSDAGLDMASVVTFEGSVTEFTWRNPHIYFTVEARDGSGQQVEWIVQMGSTNTVTSMGWTRESLLIGDLVTVGVHAAHSGRPYGLLDSIEKEGGVILPTSRDSVSAEPRLAEPEVTVSTRALDGLWMAKSSELVSYSGGFDGFFIANLELTEKGRDARAAYDPLSLENPEATCVGRPTPSMLASSHLYPIEIIFNDDETIVIRTDYWDETRTVYMDGRGHPDRSERFQTGHSIGSWDGDTLVVDVTNFADHRSPYQIGVPSGARKHVVERYRLIENGTRIAVEFTLEDPEYIAEPMTHSRELIYSPHLQSQPFDCDPETTRRFVPQ